MGKSTERKICKDVPPAELDSVLTCSHTKRCLIRAGITTPEQLMGLSPEELRQIRGIGPVIAGDIAKALEQFAARTGDEETVSPPGTACRNGFGK